MDTLIFDTSAIFNFGHRGEMEFLLEKMPADFHLFTTEQVRGEFKDPRKAAYYDALFKKHFRIESPKSDVLDEADFKRLIQIIGAGEVSVIALAKQLAGRPVIDERTARKEASKLNLAVIGTVGLLKHALARGWLDDAECLRRVEKLKKNGFSIKKPGANQTFSEYFASFSD